MAGDFTHMSVSVLLYHTTKTSQGMLWNWHFAGSKTISFSRKGMIQRKQISKKNRRASSSLHLLPPLLSLWKLAGIKSWQGRLMNERDELSLEQSACHCDKKPGLEERGVCLCFECMLCVLTCVCACVCMSLNKSNWLWIISEFLTEQNGDLSEDYMFDIRNTAVSNIWPRSMHDPRGSSK